MRLISTILFLFAIVLPLRAMAIVSHVVVAKITTGASAVQHFDGKFINQVLECSGAVSASTGAAVVKLQGSNDNVNWIDIGSCSLTLGTSVTASSIANTANWYWYRVNVTSISGTNASVDAWINY